MSNLLDTPRGRRLLFTILYAAEGGPIGLIWWALPTLLRVRQVPVGKITAVLALLVLPWAFKFLWAPLVDTLRPPGWGFKAWIACSQVLMGLTLVPLIWLDPAAQFETVAVLLFLHAVAAATQDVSVDALAIRVVPVAERGSINGYMQAGMLVGRSLFGGGALLLGDRLGWTWVFAGLLLLIWSSLLLLQFVDEHRFGGAVPGRERGRRFGRLLRSVFRRRSTWLGLAFALTSAAGFEAVGALMGPYLVDHGLEAGTIGVFLGIPVVAAMLIGGLVGGRISDRIGRIKALALSLCGFVTMIMGLGAVEMTVGADAPPALLLGLLTGMYLGLGTFVAVSYAFFMDLTDPDLGATQFSTFMAATNGCESWSAWAGGRLVASAGYAAAFFAMSAVSLLSLAILRAFPRRPRAASA